MEANILVLDSLHIFLRQVRSRSREHNQAMRLLSSAGLAGQMVAVLRQELDSMVRVIYLLTQEPDRRTVLIELSIRGQRWSREDSRAPVTDKAMVDIAQRLQGWTRSVYQFGCSFIHLSGLHDYNDRDPLLELPAEERNNILEHCRYYHGGPTGDNPTFVDLIPYLTRVLEKISANLECYLVTLGEDKRLDVSEV